MSNQGPPPNRPPSSDHPDPHAARSPNPQRRGSILSSLLSLGSSVGPPPSRESGFSSSGSSADSGSPNSYSTTTNGLCGSPNSSLASPTDSKMAPTEWGTSPHQTARRRQPSISGSLSGFASGFRWPAPGPDAAQPIPIPEAHPTPGHPAVSGSAPIRQASISGPVFRRAFELPHYSNAYQADHAPEDEAPRRGRAGSMFSSFGMGDGGWGVVNGQAPATGGERRVVARRKLSPMGERMIRDHPF